MDMTPAEKVDFLMTQNQMLKQKILDLGHGFEELKMSHVCLTDKFEEAKTLYEKESEKMKLQIGISEGIIQAFMSCVQSKDEMISLVLNEIDEEKKHFEQVISGLKAKIELRQLAKSPSSADEAKP